MTDPASPAPPDQRAVLALMRNDAPGSRAEDAGAFRQTLVYALTPQLWARGVSLPAPSSDLTGRSEPKPNTKDRARLDETLRGDTTDERRKPSAGGASLAPDPTTLAAHLLVSPVSSGRSELTTPARQAGTGSEADQPRTTAPRADADQRPAAEPTRPTQSVAGTGNQTQTPPSADSTASPSPDRNSQTSNQPTATGTPPDSAKPDAGRTPLQAPGRAVAPPSNATAADAPTATAPSSTTGVRRSSDGQIRAIPTPSAPAGRTARSPTAAGGAQQPATSIFRAEREDFAGQIGRGLASVLRQKGGSVTLRLNPEFLGQVRINLTLDESRVSARFEAASPEARLLLAQNVDSLRQALEDRGLSVERLHVVATDASQGQSDAPVSSRPHDADHQASGQHDHQQSGAQPQGQHNLSQQSTGGAPWGSSATGESRAAEAPGDAPHLETAAAYTGLDAGTPWLRIDAIA